MNQMEKLEMRRLLPETPPEGLVRWAEENLRDELGGEYFVFKYEMVTAMPRLTEIMEYNSLRPRKKVRAAVCKCTNCGEEFITQWVPGGFRVIQGEDGDIYTADPGRTYDGTDGTIVECEEGDRIICPWCEEDAAVMRASSFRGGRTKQIQVVAVQTVGFYTALIYWMVRKNFEEYGTVVDAYPRDAYILTEKGTLVRYSHVWGAGGYASDVPADRWELRTGCQDALERVYSDWGSINNRKKGGALYPVIPDLTGTTGEKTGLAAFCKQENEHLYSYIKVWKRLPVVENLLNTGWSQIVEDLVGENVRGYDDKIRAGNGLNIEARKPHEILRMSKADFRELSKLGANWSLDTQEMYVQVLRAGLVRGAMDFYRNLQSFRASGIRTMIDLNRIYGGITFDRAARYMQKQRLSRTEIGLLLDTRRMAKELSPDRELTPEELWPKNLRETHDRLTEITVRRRKEAERTRYQAGFDHVLAEYGEIQWTDGELCVVLPTCENDLIQEGKILRHCVGGYGKAHAEGGRLIFFIRHYRRPERSYYTLNIDVNGNRPIEIQLHGYGNERHGKNKEHAHKIPAKVRAFCDRWEKEILLPWYEEKKKRARKERKSA